MRIVPFYRPRSAKRTYSHLCNRTFDSAGEAKRAEELFLLAKGKKISDLQFQPIIYLSRKSPKVSYRADFRYVNEHGATVIEDVKGNAITREQRVKLVWLKTLGYDVRLLRPKGKKGWERVTL